jgi:poly(A) polymerase
VLKSLYIDIRNRLRELIAGTEFDGKVFFVGGCCRDDIMGTEIKDIDISVALPDGGIRLAEWLRDNGHTAGEVSAYPEFHTAKFRLADFPDVELESVHTRKESYPDRGSRNPVTDYGTHEEDCFRRDFTVNALYQNISTGEIIDITGKGIDDIREQIIRTPSDPFVKFDEDPLRILRCIRFAARFGWKIAQETFDAMRAMVPRMEILTPGRISEEFMKMLSDGHPAMAMELLKSTGAMHYVLPVFEQTYDMAQNKYHFGTVWDHTVAVLEETARQTDDVYVRLAALLHDIGKIITRTVDAEGNVHFYKHEFMAMDMVRDVMKSLNLPNEEIATVQFLVSHHMCAKNWGYECERMKDKSLRKLQHACRTWERFQDLMIIVYADNMSHAQEYCMPRQSEVMLERTRQMMQEGSAMFGYRPVLTGKEIMEIKGLGPGPQIKKCQDYLMALAFNNPLMTREEAIKFLKGYRL